MGTAGQRLAAKLYLGSMPVGPQDARRLFRQGSQKGGMGKGIGAPKHFQMCGRDQGRDASCFRNQRGGVGAWEVGSR